MEEIAKSFRSLFEKVGEFFDLFDLSFFVSGAIASSAIFLWMHLAGNNPFAGLDNWLKVLGVILTFYVSGLVCFSAGRWLRTGIRRHNYNEQFDKYFFNTLEAHGLDAQEPFKAYLDRTQHRGISRLYVRLWAEVRQCPTLIPSFSLLKRYWVMAATYDGIAMSIWVWIFMIFCWCSGYSLRGSLDWKLGIPVMIFLLVASLSCSREAGRYAKYQIEELVASIATQRAKKE